MTQQELLIESIGNPAAVLLFPDDEKIPSDDILQKIAREMNHSETAFVQKRKSNEYNLRWFTPTTEVVLCGHATLASAHVLYELGKEKDTIIFHTLSGELKTQKGKDGSILMDFPTEKDPIPLAVDEKVLSQIVNEFNIESKEKIVQVYLSSGKWKLGIIEVDSPDTVLKIVPRDPLKIQFKESIEGILITTKGSGDFSKYDFVSRCFYPSCGVLEDPVTGSAHAVLARFWGTKLKKTKMFALQASQRRGELDVTLLSDDRVLIGGKAVTVLRGTIKV